MSAARTPEEIRASIEANRAELALAVETLRGTSTAVETAILVAFDAENEALYRSLL